MIVASLLTAKILLPSPSMGRVWEGVKKLSPLPIIPSRQGRGNFYEGK